MARRIKKSRFSSAILSLEDMKKSSGLSLKTFFKTAKLLTPKPKNVILYFIVTPRYFKNHTCERLCVMSVARNVNPDDECLVCDPFNLFPLCAIISKHVLGFLNFCGVLII